MIPLEWLEPYRERRHHYWPEIDAFFNNLPPALFRQGKILQYDLALRHSETGQFKDILLDIDQFPLPYLPLWLVDDFGFPNAREARRLEKHLSVAMLLFFATMYVHDSIVDDASFCDRDYMMLAHVLASGVTRQFAQIFPATSTFWNDYHALWNEYLEGVLWEDGCRQRLTAPQSPEELLHPGRWSAPSKMVAVAVAAAAGREADVPTLFAMMDDLSAAYQIKEDLAAIRRDIQRGKLTYPIVRIMVEAGIPWQRPVVPEEVLGAMVLTNSIEIMCNESLARLHACLRNANCIGLNTLSAYLSRAEAMIQELRGSFSLRETRASAPGHPSKDDEQPRPFFLAYAPPLPQALDMAERFLLSDLTFREIWEVHREGMLGAPEVVSKFPAGLIIEILCEHGHDLAEQVEEFCRQAQATRFRYYDHPFADPDTDTLGVLLRLYAYAPHKERQRRMLEEPLRWLEANTPVSGQIPVWMTAYDDPLGGARPPVLRLGEGCGTVEAHLLLGLIDVAWEDYRSIIEESATNLLDRVAGAGVGVNVNYPPLYSLGVLIRLVSTLESRPLEQSLRSRMAKASQRLLAELGTATKRVRITPQDAAFLTLACLKSSRRHLISRRWITVMLKNQRFDGSWYAEPFAASPNRGQAMTWYGSTALTTAFCYHALKQHVRWADILP